jgi:hypothetical protein
VASDSPAIAAAKSSRRVSSYLLDNKAPSGGRGRGTFDAEKRENASHLSYNFARHPPFAAPSSQRRIAFKDPVAPFKGSEEGLSAKGFKGDFEQSPPPAPSPQRRIAFKAAFKAPFPPFKDLEKRLSAKGFKGDLEQSVGRDSLKRDDRNDCEKSSFLGLKNPAGAGPQEARALKGAVEKSISFKGLEEAAGAGCGGLKEAGAVLLLGGAPIYRDAECEEGANSTRSVYVSAPSTPRFRSSDTGDVSPRCMNIGAANSCTSAATRSVYVSAASTPRIDMSVLDVAVVTPRLIGPGSAAAAAAAAAPPPRFRSAATPRTPHCIVGATPPAQLCVGEKSFVTLDALSARYACICSICIYAYMCLRIYCIPVYVYAPPGELCVGEKSLVILDAVRYTKGLMH